MRDRKRVRFRIDATVVAQSKGPVEGRMRDGAPEINDLEAALEERRDVGGRKVPVDAGDGRFGGLIDMHSDDGLAGLWGIPDLAWAIAADG